MGSEVVYLASRSASAATMTPYDVCAIRLTDASVLAGSPPDDAARYVAALRTGAGRAVAGTREGDVVAADLRALIEHLSGSSWDEVLGSARAAGALMGAYSTENE